LCVGGCLIKNVRANILHAKDSETYREETEDNMLKKLVTVAIVFGMILYGATLTVKAAEEEQAEAVQTKEEQAEAVQAEGVQLEDSYVRPDYVEVERLKSTKNVIVIEKKDIEGKGYQNLSDVLNDNPSINVGVTGYGDIDIRGQGSDQAQRNIQVMLDGAPITTLTSHPFMNDYNYIPVDAIEKIEIIPGGGSVMYGSGAAGGVINITTNLKRMTKPVTSIQTTYGETGKDTTLNFGYKFTDKLTSQLTYTRSDKDLYFKNTWKDSNYLAGGLSYLINPQSRLRFRYSHLKDDGQFIASLQKKNFDKYGKDYVPSDKTITVGIDDDGKKIKRVISGYLIADRELDMYSVNYAKNFSKVSRISADAFFNDGYFRNNNQGDKKMDQSTRGVKLKYDYQYGADKQHRVLVGLDRYKQEAKLQYNNYKGGYGGKPVTLQPLHFFYDKTVKALYASNTLRKGKWEFVQGARRDYTDWGYDKTAASSSGEGVRETSNTALEVATSYQYNDIGRIYLRYEKGFTSPDGVQMADDYGDSIVATAAEDEKFDLYEIGLRDKIGISTIQLTVFYSKTDNQMDRWYAFTSDGFVRRTLNLLETERRGVELSARQKVKKWTFSEGYTYLKGHSDYNDFGKRFIADNDKTVWTQQSLKQVPKHKFLIRTAYDFNRKLSGTVQYNYVGAYNNFYEDEDAEDNRIGSHQLVDLDFTYKINPALILYTGVKNVFNEEYTYYQTENSGGYYSLLPGDERMYYIGARYRF
jgi:iron complex outermembrane receptor protein